MEQKVIKVKKIRILNISIAVLLLSMLMVGASGAATYTSTENLLLNPGFENVTAGNPTNWWVYDVSGISHIYPGPGRISGNSIGIITNSGLGNVYWGQKVFINSSKKYALSGYIQTQKISGNGIIISLDWFDNANKYLGNTALPSIKGTTPWTYYEKTNIVPLANSAKVNVILQSAFSTGTVYFDDVSLYEMVTKPVYSFVDDFNSLNTDTWGYEYTYPNVSNGYARFNLNSGTLNTATTWSKLSYKPSLRSYGNYSITFKYNRRPTEAEVWAGWALYLENTQGVQEINFGIETACILRCSNKSLVEETYKNNVNTELISQTGKSMFDGTWHTVDLIYTSSSIIINFDGTQVGTIITNIPTESMKLITGARVISGKLSSLFYMDVDRISYSAST